MNITLNKPQYTITLDAQAVGVVHAALQELPAKLSMRIIESLVQQVLRQENPPPFLAPVPSPEPTESEIVNRIMGEAP